MLSGVIIAWNEANNLPVAIKSLNGLVDETIVIVDEASSDNTYEVAKGLGCKVFRHPHTGIVEPMRNFAISKAKGDWILLLDADEEVSSGLAGRVKELLKAPKADFYKIPRKNIIFGKWIISEHWWPDLVFRLFKKDSLKWDKTIHSLPFTRGEGAQLEINPENVIIHHNYKLISEYLGKLDRYTDHLKTAVLSKGYSFSTIDLIAKPIDEFNNQLFARRGYKDGIHGLALALLQAFTELVLYLKLWEDEGNKELPLVVDELDNQLKMKSKEFKWWNYQMKIDHANPIQKMWLKIARKIGV